MLQLKVLSGKMAGTDIVARHFPFCVGRAKGNNFILDEPGLFDRHFRIELNDSKEFVLQAEPNAFVAVSGEQNLRSKFLKNADVIEVGQTKILFTLSATKQHGLALREISTWVALGILTLSQLVLICWLMKS